MEHASTKYLNNKINFISIVDNKEEGSVDALVLTNHFFCYVDIGNKRIIHEVELNEIKEISLESTHLKVITDKSSIMLR